MSDVPKIKREILGDEALRLEYRQKVSEALALAQGYQGKQAQSEFLLAKLADIERWLIEKFGAKHELGGLPPGLEMEIIAEWCDEVERNRSAINDLLGVSSEAHKQFLESALRGVGEDLCQVQMDFVLLPPGEGPEILQGNGTNPMEGPVFQERVRDLLLALEGVGIYSDDVILIRGKLSRREMRRLSYVIIEIPKLGREILINDQVGEATFVIDGIMSRQYLVTITKGELQDNHPEEVLRVIYRDKGYWLGEIMGFLLKDVEDTKELIKLDVSLQENIRRIIIAEYPTPEAWADMHWEKKEHKINNKGLIAIARLFGIMVGNPKSNGSVFLALGRAIYGSEHECLWPLTKEYVKKWFLEKYPLPEAWVNLSSEERLAIRIKRQTLRDVARLFGLTGDPAYYKRDILALGREVYGDHHDCLNVLNKEFLKSKILGKYPTPEMWSKMTDSQKRNFSSHLGIDIGIKAASSVFGIKGYPVKNPATFMAFGRAIYGSEHACLQYQEKPQVEKVVLEECTTQEARTCILERWPTAAAWTNMPNEEKKKLKIKGRGLRAIASLFGLKGSDPILFHAHFLQLGRAIYGERHECLNVLDKIILKRILLRIYPNKIDWEKMPFKNKANFKKITSEALGGAAGLGLQEVARVFSVKGNPIKKREVYLELVKAIWNSEEFEEKL